MRNTVSLGFVLGLAAIFVLTPGGADADIKADQCHALGCRVVIQGSGSDASIWCCCEKKGGTNCDVLSAHPTGPNPTLRPRMTRPPTRPPRTLNPNLRRNSPRQSLPVE